MNTPRTLGRYDILETIGQGMQGRIFRARDDIFGEVALKAAVIPESATAEDIEALRRRLEVEAKRQRELSSTCASILPAYDVVTADDGQIYVVQAYAEGGSLRSLDGPVRDEQRLADWGCQLCDALQTAHDASIFHCDVKPENILRDGGDNPKLTDFGVAVETSRVRGDTPLVGTPAYMAPELWETNRPGPATDLFALGVVLYELATGKHPYDLTSGDTEHVRKRICETNGLPMRARVAWPQVSPELAAILDRAVARDPTERYRSCKLMRRDLAGHREHLESRETQVVRGGTVPLPLRVRLRRFARRAKRRVRPVLVIAAALAIAGVVWTFFPRTLVPEPWIVERIGYFNDALVDRDAQGLVDEIWRNADGDAPDEQIAIAERAFQEFEFYNTVKLRIAADGFNQADKEVRVELVAEDKDLPEPGVVLTYGTIPFVQDGRGPLMWKDPTLWLGGDPSTWANHRKAVTDLFIVRFWRPLQKAFANHNADDLATLYQSPPAKEELDEMLAWLGAYGREPKPDDWDPQIDPREKTTHPWSFHFDETETNSFPITLGYTLNDGRWKLTGPLRLPEPEEHVAWAVDRLLDRYETTLRHADPGDATLHQALSLPDNLDADARRQLADSFAWLCETERSALKVQRDDLRIWPMDTAAATAYMHITYQPVSRARRARPTSTSPSPASAKPLSFQASLLRNDEGRWIPALPLEFAVPEPLRHAAERLLVGNDVEDDTSSTSPGRDFAARITNIAREKWPENRPYLSTETSIVRIDETSATAEIEAAGRYSDGPVTRIQPKRMTLPLRRGSVRWHLPTELDRDMLRITPPSEHVDIVAKRFDTNVWTVLESVFMHKTFNATAFEALLGTETTERQQARFRDMFAWLARHADVVTFRLVSEQPIPGDPNTATVRLDADFIPGDADAPDDYGDDWWAADWQFVERTVGQWTLSIDPADEVIDYAWLPPPTLVRFDDVAADLVQHTWDSLFQRYLPDAVKPVLADALERMRAWTQLESTQVKVENVGAAQVNIDGDITVPMTLRADYGDQSAQHTLALQFTETTDQPNAWTLTALNDDRYQRRYIWPEPPEHAAWCVTRRLERAAAAHAAGDAAGYAQAITGDAEHADDFIDFLAEYGPDRYRFIVSSVEAPTDLDHGVHANAALTANADRVQLEGVFYWQSDQWLAASPSDWLKSTLTARRVLRKLRSGDWVEAHALFADLPPDEKSRAQSAIDATTFPAAWRSGASDQSDPATGLPLWFDDADQIRYRLVMTDWPDAGGRYALYVQEIETSTAQWMQAWPQVAGELKKRGASNGDLTEDWNQRNAMEVRDPLQDAISSVTWKQALTFARLRERDLPSEAEWLVAAGVLDVDPSRLVGGVWEWCRDEEGDGHVIRGGCWLNAVDGTPTTDLRSVQGRVPDETIGFRTVIRIPPQRIP